MDKPVLYFYTNMPTPYQLDFLDALSVHFRLTVVYFSVREKDRQWQLPVSSQKYATIVLKNNVVARTMQRLVSSFHFSAGIIGVAKKSQADMVIVNGSYWSPNVWLALFIHKKRARKTAYWAEPVFAASHKVKRSIKKLLLSAVFVNTDLLLAIGKKAIECYTGYGYTKMIYNIPYNINTSLFSPAGLDESVMAQLRRTYKSNGELIFLSSGSLVHRKGMDTLIRAFLLLPEHYNAALIIIGAGNEKDKLVALAGADRRIYFAGFQEKEMVPYWFALADVFLFASRYDGWALVINEAMAAGKAIICSYQTGAAYDSLVHRQNALLYDAEDLDGFAAGIQELASDEAMRNQLAERAYEKGIELSSQNMAKKIYDIYRVG